jgi:hypothetical protein
MYVIERTDQGGGYLRPAGSAKAWTHKLQEARQFATEKEADDERCKGNEVVRNVRDIMPH